MHGPLLSQGSLCSRFRRCLRMSSSVGGYRDVSNLALISGSEPSSSSWFCLSMSFRSCIFSFFSAVSSTVSGLIFFTALGFGAAMGCAFFAATPRFRPPPRAPAATISWNQSFFRDIFSGRKDGGSEVFKTDGDQVTVATLLRHSCIVQVGRKLFVPT